MLREPLYLPKESSFTVSVKYIDVEEANKHPFASMMCGTLAAKRPHSEMWNGSSRFRIHNKRPPKGYSGLGGLLTKTQSTWRLETIWPEVWSSVSHGAHKKAKQQWDTEKPKLQAAGQTRDIMIFLPGEVEDFDVLFRSARKKLWVVTVSDSTAKAPTRKVAASEARLSLTKTARQIPTFDSQRCVLQQSEILRMRINLQIGGCHSWHHWYTRQYPPANP